MAALKVIGIILLILLLLASVRVGVILRFGDQTTLKLRIGPIRLTILPRMKRKHQKQNEVVDAAPKKTASPKKRNKLTPFEISDLVTAVFSGLGTMARRAGKHLRVDPLELSVLIGGGDPAEVAQRFGFASAAVWSLMPRAEEIIRIPDPAIHLDMDYNAPRTVLSGTVGLSFRVGNLTEFIVAAAIPLLRWYRTYRKAHANDPRPAEAAGEATEQTEKAICMRA